MILVTGAAGFLGFHTSRTLLEQGQAVIGIDNLTPYYDVSLKKARLEQLKPFKNITFIEGDIADREAITDLFARHQDITAIIHLAAQAGVRYSLQEPFAYSHSNLDGQLVMLEAARHCKKLEHFVYASSSSVYGGNTKQPFAVGDPVDEPLSLYAATKRADELLVQSYAHLYGFPATGLRFFTVYGPWGRPDMAYFSFTQNIVQGKPITVFNEGRMKRDFTWVEDCVSGILGALSKPPAAGDRYCVGNAPHRIFNIGNNRPEELLTFIELIENALGQKAEKIMAPIAPGDVEETWADITPAQEIFGYSPQTPLSAGIPRFVQWYCDYHNISLAA